MAKGKSGKTFFEVYGSQSQKGSDIPVVDKGGKGKVPEDIPAFEGEELIVISDIADGLHVPGERPPRGGEGKGILVTIIIAAVCGVALAIGTFFLGLSLGKVELPRKEVTAKAPEQPTIERKPAAETKRKQPEPAKAPEPIREKQVAKAPAPLKERSVEAGPTPPVAPPSAFADTWTLRIISYSDVQKNLEKAAAVADFLQSSTGYDAFVARLGNKLVVCLGEFGSKNSLELLELQKQVRAFEYENRKQFLSSYPVRIK